MTALKPQLGNVQGGTFSTILHFQENGKALRLQLQQKLALDPAGLTALEDVGVQIKIELKAPPKTINKFSA